jgi:4-hydroxybenzoyl-CoA thioesterase
MITNRRKVRIQWGDCDPAGIVYFPRYFVYFDESTAALFELAGLRKRVMMKTYEFVGMPAVDVHAKFYIPSEYGDDVEIESSVAKWGRSSFEVHHRLLKGSELAVEGFEKRVWVGPHPDRPGGMQARAIPAEVIQRFRKG